MRVHVRISEGDKERIQVFEGNVIGLHRSEGAGSFTVRKVSYGVGVERIFPLRSPRVEKVEIKNRGIVRRAKLYYLRERTGRSARSRLASISSRAIASARFVASGEAGALRVRGGGIPLARAGAMEERRFHQCGVAVR